MYRVFTHLSNGKVRVEPGLSNLKQFTSKSIQLLLEREAIAVVSTPPLRLLEGLEDRVEALNEVGILSVEDLLDTPTATLQQVLGDDYKDVISTTLRVLFPEPLSSGEEISNLEEEEIENA